MVLVVRGETGGMKIALEIQLGMGILTINGSVDGSKILTNQLW